MDIDQIKIFVPEIENIFNKRYEILQFLLKEGTVGRRIISEKLNFSERVIREEIEKLKVMGLVSVNSAGVTITCEGRKTLKDLYEVYSNLSNLKTLEKEVREILGVKKVVVVKGDASLNEDSFTNIGQAAAKLILNEIKEKDVIGITGGKTLYYTSKEIGENTKVKDLLVIPARGSLGRNVSYQANSIAPRFAKHLGAKYELLPVPDSASEEAMEILLKDEQVRYSYETLQKMTLLLFGIGKASVMLERRGVSQETKEEILKLGAEAEAFGYYFDTLGKEVYHQHSIGIGIKEFLKIDRVIGVAGGSEKAKALMSVARLRKDMSLVIDEGLAEKIIEIKKMGGKQ